MIKGNGVITSPKHDMNRITVSLEGVRVTGVFEAHWSWSTKASSLAVGTDVRGMVENDKLIVLTSEGKTIKAKIVRRELESRPSRPGENDENTSSPHPAPCRNLADAGDAVRKVR